MIVICLESPESDWYFLALKHSFTVRLLTLRDLYRDSIFDNIWQYLTLLTIVFIFPIFIFSIFILYIIFSILSWVNTLCLNNMLLLLLLLYMWLKLFVWEYFLFLCISPITNISKFPLLFFLTAFIDNSFIKLLCLLVKYVTIFEKYLTWSTKYLV